MRSKHKYTETRRALEWAEARLCDGYVSLPCLVWRCLEDAADTLSRMPDKERVYLLAGDRISWPQIVHTAQEQYEAELQRQHDLQENPYQTPLPRRLAISDPTALPRMLTVLGWLQYVRGRTPMRIKRDKLIALALAQGQTVRWVQKNLMGADKSESAVKMVKQKVVGQIATRLETQLTLSVTPSNCVNSTR